MKNEISLFNLAREAKKALNIDGQLSIRQLRNKLFNIDEQDQTFINNMTVRQVRAELFDIENQETRIN